MCVGHSDARHGLARLLGIWGWVSRLLYSCLTEACLAVPQAQLRAGLPSRELVRRAHTNTELRMHLANMDSWTSSIICASGLWRMLSLSANPQIQHRLQLHHLQHCDPDAGLAGARS